MESDCLPVLLNKFLFLCCHGKDWKLKNYFQLKKIIAEGIDRWYDQTGDWKEAYFALINFP